MRKLLYCALGRFDTPTKLFRLIKMRLNVTYSTVHTSRHGRLPFLLRMAGNTKMYPINLQLPFIERCRQGQTVRESGVSGTKWLVSETWNRANRNEINHFHRYIQGKIIVTNTGHIFYSSDTETTCDLDSVVGIATSFRQYGSGWSPGAVKGTLLDRPSGTASLLHWVME